MIVEKEPTSTKMDDELQELRDLVVQLRADKERLMQERTEVVAPPVGASMVNSVLSDRPVTSAVPERLLYVPRERKCPLFRGNPGIEVVEWIEEVRASMRARHLAPLDQAYFIYDHLEGEAKNEIRYRSRGEREDPEKILSILQELYGCSQSYVALQEDFFCRKQLEGESLKEYSHALFSLMERVVKCAPNGLPNSAVLLRDQFVEHVNDPNLRRTLKQVVRDKPGCTLLDVRAEAIRWEQEGRPVTDRARSYSVPSICALQTSRVPDTQELSSPQMTEIAELKEMMVKQQRQLTELSERFMSLQQPFRRNSSSRTGPVVCRRCQQPGHFASSCDNERVVSQVQYHQPRHQPRPPRTLSPSNQPTEN